MKYSRKQIDKAGYIIASPDTDVLAYTDAVNIIDDWRKLHMAVLEALVSEISSILSGEDIHPRFSSQRLKRIISIREKLQHTPNMGLGGVQDIGGARYVFDDIPTLMRAKEVIAGAELKNFTLDHEVYDYVETPKQSGYRSIHFVYKYHTDDEERDGMRVELQIRTQLQHDWATAVETAELISKSSLKASLGDENWLEFFKLVSAVFAREEGTSVGSAFQSCSEQDLCVRYAELDRKYQFVAQLQGLVDTVSMAEEQSFDGGYALVVIEYEKKRVTMRHFSADRIDEANRMYAQAEGNVERDKSAVVLVAVSDIKELRAAYPSYFLNANEFITAVSDFHNQCRVKGFC